MAVLSLIAALGTAPARADGKLYYGSRAGMQVLVISMTGLDTGRAVIRTKHTREDAVAFCRDYVGKVTPNCIREELEKRLNSQVTANCPTGEFTDLYGGRFRFAGPAKAGANSARYKLVDLASGEEADGSSASGYGTNLGIFRALCPRRAPRDE